MPGSSPSSACHRGRRQSLFDTNVGRFGAPGEKCDAPILLMQQTLDWVAREWGNKLDFIIWTGDNARHVFLCGQMDVIQVILNCIFLDMTGINGRAGL